MLKIAKFTKEEYDSYEDSLKVYRDWKNTIATAVAKAQKEEREREMKEGREAEKREIA